MKLVVIDITDEQNAVAVKTVTRPVYTLDEMNALYNEWLVNKPNMAFLPYVEYKENPIVDILMKDCEFAQKSVTSKFNHTTGRWEGVPILQCGKDHCTCVDSPTYYKNFIKG
jgi:hypothetical protein